MKKGVDNNTLVRASCKKSAFVYGYAKVCSCKHEMVACEIYQ